MRKRSITDIMKVAKSGESFLMCIPKDIIDLLGIDENTFVDNNLKMVGKQKREVGYVNN